MNKIIFSLFLLISLHATFGVAEDADEQKKFDEALEEYLQKRSIPKFSVSEPRVKKSTRRSSKQAKLLHDVFTFEQQYKANQIANGKSKRTTYYGATVSSTYCPYQTFTCNSTAYYRTVDGSCNNLANSQYGASNTPYTRMLTPAYQDGVSSPRSLSVNGSALPNPRTISLTMSPPLFGSDQLTTKTLSHLYPIFGQFLTHNIGGVSATTDSSGNELDCPCSSTDTSNCMGITVPSGDKYLGQTCYNTQAGCPTGTVSTQTCMNFTRSSATYPDFTCKGTYREQLNLLSSYIDGTAIYGLDSVRSNALRSFSGGALLTSSGIAAVASAGLTSRTYLPLSTTDATCTACYTYNNCTTKNTIYNCFLGGEWRTSENLALTSIQTLFNREHNRIAATLASLNPTWSDETIYQQTRRIVIAELQDIVYGEFVPLINGSSALSPLSSGYYTGYNSSLNAALTNEFITAGFRMGHSMILQQLRQFNVNQTYYGQSSNYMFESIVFQSDLAYSTTYQGLNSIFMGLINMNAWLFGTFGNQLQNNLQQVTYTNGTTTAADLFAINVQRGRDHGLQPYYKYLQACTGKTISSFTDLTGYMSSTNIAKLQTLYASVYDIDLFVGGLAETVSANANIATGTTFACINMNQFQTLKNSDRFYYENSGTYSPYPFTSSQLTSIRNVTLAGLICNNFDLYSIQPKAFLVTSVSGNSAVSCSTLMGQLNLTLWQGIL